MTNTIKIPDYCLVLLVGPSGCGKSTFGAQHFLPTEIVSSDTCRGIVADDETALSATGDAFDLVHFIVEKRLAARRLTVVDATNVKSEDRAGLVRLAKKYHALTIAFTFLIPENVCLARNKSRPDRQFGPHVVRNHMRSLRRGLRRMNREGIRFVYKLNSEEEANDVEIVREPLWTDRRGESGPFDLIGDVHGCATELEQLLEKLGYAVAKDGNQYTITPPEGRRAIFLGDLVDRGPRTPDSLRIAKAMVDAGDAFAILGNHEAKLVRALNGRNVKVAHGLGESLEQLAVEPDEDVEDLRRFMDKMISHFVLDDGKLVVAHAGIREDMQGRSSGAVRAFCLYGETTGETDEFGLPVRYNWASEYRGDACVIYGHTPVPEAEWLNNTICLDTGCVFGGKLTAMRWPERELVSVPAEQVYMEPVKPLAPERVDLSAQQQVDTDLDIAEVTGKRMIHTALRKTITIHEGQSAAALEVMSRFAVDPRWLIHLPPTMSPSETSSADGYLEHPDEAFQYFRAQGVERVVCEEKHMGSRAIIVICRDADAAKARFGVEDGDTGVIYTRTGRPFFNDAKDQDAVLKSIRRAMKSSGLWDELATDWVCLDAEIMPWSVKAQALIHTQYAPVGAASRVGLGAAKKALSEASAGGLDLEGLVEKFAERKARADQFADGYRPYVWRVDGPQDMRIAPFHMLASEGAVHAGKDHEWHMQMCHRIADAGSEMLMATQYRVVDLADETAVASATKWWADLTSKGGEGMVVKPMDYVTKGEKGLVQPAVKCRGREYLRIIYGAEYDAPEHLERLRKRGLGKKRSLAMREFALGMEGLERFVAREPLRRVHECAFAVLALESEPVDPRL